MRLVILGGSGASTPELIDAINEWPGGAERRPPLELVLQGRSARKLALVADACRSRLAASVRDVRVRAESSLPTALDGADVVLIGVRVGGLDARFFDETFPRSHGLPGEETLGPGGFANALRTVPALAGAWDVLAQHAADAFIIDLTNPAGIVTQAATAHTGRRVVSVCDSPVTFVDGIARSLGRPAAEVRLGYAGLNHCGFWVGTDPETMAAAASPGSGLDAADISSLGAVPLPYLRFYQHPDRELAAQLAATESRAQVLKRTEAAMLEQYTEHTDSASQTRRGAVWYRLAIVPLLDALVRGGTESFILGLPNEGAVDWAPDESIVELPTAVRAGGSLIRHRAAEMPAGAARVLRAHAEYETSTAHALAGTRSYDDVRARRTILVEALARNPMVERADLAERLVDEILDRSPA